MGINAIWTAFCDGPTDHMGTDPDGISVSMAWAYESDTRGECIRRAKRNGWSVVGGVALCPKCRAVARGEA